VEAKKLLEPDALRGWKGIPKVSLTGPGCRLGTEGLKGNEGGETE